jgi:leader peptidase (prepilin peptidase)/N-methyltransferase
MDFFFHAPLLAGGYVFFISLCVGSFLNVVIYRLPVMMERQWKEEAAAMLSDDEPALPPVQKNSI